MSEVYRVVREDGGYVGVGRGSDPFTNPVAAKRRATWLTNQYRNHGIKFVVEVAEVNWRRLDV